MQERLLLKVKDGQIYNWVGSIRERIFRAREGEGEETAKKFVRRNTRSMGERGILNSPTKRRISRSTNDLSRLMAMKQYNVSKDDNTLELPCVNRPHKNEEQRPASQERYSNEMRSRKLSNSVSSVLSGKYVYCILCI